MIDRNARSVDSEDRNITRRANMLVSGCARFNPETSIGYEWFEGILVIHPIAYKKLLEYQRES